MNKSTTPSAETPAASTASDATGQAKPIVSVNSVRWLCPKCFHANPACPSALGHKFSCEKCGTVARVVMSATKFRNTPSVPEQPKPEGVKGVSGEAELIEALTAITKLGGNLPDEALEDRTGPNDAAARGIMYTGARAIARNALAANQARRHLIKDNSAALRASHEELLAVMDCVMTEWDSDVRSTQCFDSRIITRCRVAKKKAEAIKMSQS